MSRSWWPPANQLDPLVRQAFVRAIGQFEEPEDVERLLVYLNDASLDVRRQALRAIVQEYLRGEEERFFEPAYWGPAGWVGLDLRVAEPDWDEVRELVDMSYRNTAPARLVRQLDAGPPGA